LKYYNKIFNFKKSINDKKVLLDSLLDSEKSIIKIINKITIALKKKGKILFCGNGGSASDSQHLATEFLVRLRPKINRSAIPALALSLDSTYLTACANDFGYNYVFSRSLESFGNKNDILVVISTSGNSKNIIEVLKKAKKMGIFTIGLFGKNGGAAKKHCNFPLIVKSQSVARIQEVHIFLGHIILESVENNLIKSNFISKFK
jgi:D-sedoheptulose 7-phosphate isomerase